MSYRDTLLFCLQALGRQRGRLTTLLLAMALAVSSVLVMTALGEGARGFVAAEFTHLGKDLLVMFPGRKETTGGMPPITGNTLRDITLDDMAYLQQRIPHLRLVPLVMGFAEARHGARLRQTMLLGASNDMRHTHQLTLLQGHWLPEDASQDASVCLLGKTVASALFQRPEQAVGQWVRFDNRRFRVVGLFSSQSSNLGMEFNEAALVPVAAAQRLFNVEGLFRLLIQPLAGQPLPGLIRQLELRMQERHQGVLDVTVLRRDAMLQSVNRILATLSLCVAGIGAISLLVAGIMMMNLALISTHQRRGEIGLLQALGANRALIRRLFLTEALLLGGAGAWLGIVLGYLLVLGGRLLWPSLPLQIPLLTTLLAGGGALITALLFSWLPARQAAQQDPVTSLHSASP